MGDRFTSLLERAERSNTLVGDGVDIWASGGWAMIALAGVSLFIFAIGVGVWLRLRAKKFRSVPEETWRRWIIESGDREGTVGKTFDEVDRVLEKGRSSVHDAFAEIRAREVTPFGRDLKLMQIAVGAAPLVGLLGTVTGMLATFDALSTGGGGDKTMASIAEGISEALFTTETGLVIALPGLFFHYFLSRKFEKFRAFLTHVEAVWAQQRLTSELERVETRQREVVHSLARLEIKKRILERLQLA